MHEAIAKYGFQDKPAYLNYIKDDAEVMFSKSKWNQVSDEIKMRGAIEEVYCLALERSAIPYRGKIDPFVSFKIALEKLSTSISSGIFRDWVYDNYYQIINNVTFFL